MLTIIHILAFGDHRKQLLFEIVTSYKYYYTKQQNICRS